MVFELGKPDFVDRNAAMRLWVTNIKAKDFKEVAEKSLPHEAISATTLTVTRLASRQVARTPTPRIGTRTMVMTRIPPRKRTTS